MRNFRRIILDRIPRMARRSGLLLHNPSSPPSPQGRRGRLSRWERIEVRAIGISRALFVTLAAVVLLIISILWLPLPASLQQSCVGTLRLLDCRGREIAEIASPEARAQLPRRLDELGKWLPRVTVALEDHRFYEHAGVDWRATASACTRNLKAHRIVSGASTITQQLVKMASGRQRRSWFGKFYETIVAWKIERRWSKERILTEYLNRSSYGNRRLGPEAAARAYFGKSARDLTLAESIFLAGLPQAPTRFNPWRHPELATRKYERSLARLAQLGVISGEEQALLAKSAPVAPPVRSAASGAAFCRCRVCAESVAPRHGEDIARSRFTKYSRTICSLPPCCTESLRYHAGGDGYSRQRNRRGASDGRFEQLCGKPGQRRDAAAQLRLDIKTVRLSRRNRSTSSDRCELAT